MTACVEWQEGDHAVAQLLGEYRWLIGQLRSKLERGGILLATATVGMSAVPVPRDPGPESHKLGGQGPDPGSGSPSTARPQESAKPLCPCVTAASGNGLPARPPFRQSPTPDNTSAGGEKVPDPVWTPATPPMMKLFPNAAISRTQGGKSFGTFSHSHHTKTTRGKALNSKPFTNQLKPPLARKI